MAEQRACDIPGYEYFCDAFAVDDVARLDRWTTENVRMPVGDVLDLMLGVALTQFFAMASRYEADQRDDYSMRVISRRDVDHAREMSTMHRRAQRAESALAKADRRIRYERQAYERMRDVVCEAWEALPAEVREEITSPDHGDRLCQDNAPDLVRGVKMLVDESVSRIDELERETSSLATRCHALHQRFDAPGAVTDAEARGREQGRLAAEREHAVELGRRDTLDAERSVIENALRRQLGRVEAQVAAMRNAGEQGERS